MLAEGEKKPCVKPRRRWFVGGAELVLCAILRGDDERASRGRKRGAVRKVGSGGDLDQFAGVPISGALEGSKSRPVGTIINNANDSETSAVWRTEEWGLLFRTIVRRIQDVKEFGSLE